MADHDDLVDRLKIDATRREPASRGVVVKVVAALLVLAVLLVAAVLLAGRPPEVRVVRPQPAPDAGPGAAAASVLDASGYVVARRQATVAAEVTGKLVEVDVEEGMRVEKGQVLARLDDSTERARLALAESRVDAADAALQELRVQLADAERTLERQQELRARDLVSQALVDEAQTAVDTLRARLASGREQLQVARREVELQQQLVDELVVRAPFSGIVIARAAQAGEMVSPISAGGGFTRTGICTIVDMDSLEIEVDVNEAYIDRVSQGQQVAAVLDAYPDWRIPARVIAVVPAADRQKATVRVRVGLLERDPRILPDMGVSVRFLDSSTDDAPGESGPAAGATVLRVPASAVIRRDGRDVVFVVEDGRVERRAVRLAGRDDAGTVRIAAGLARSDRIIVDAADHELADGDRVRLAED